MKLFNKSNKPYYEFQFEIGDVVEMEYEGKWLLGEISQYNSDDEIHFSHFHGGSYYKIYEHKFRQTNNTIKQAKEYYLNLIDYNQREIDHTNEKEQIAEFKKLIKKLPKKGKS